MIANILELLAALSALVFMSISLGEEGINGVHQMFFWILIAIYLRLTRGKKND